MGARFLRALSVAVITAVLAIVAESSTARAAGGCDISGPGTDRLCSGGHLPANHYLISPNGRYRFYYQDDGHTLIYDTIDWNNWVHSTPLFSPHENAGYFMYGVNASGYADGEINLWSFTPWHTSALPYSLYWGDGVGSGHYMKLDDDGCLRAYQSDVSFMTTIWC